MEKIITKYPSVIVKTSEPGALGYSKQLSTVVIKTFKDGQWSGLKCAHDSLLKNAEIIVEENKLIITGTKIIYHSTILNRLDYGKKYELYYEYDKDGKKMTIADVQRQLAFNSLKVADSDIKLFYDGFIDFIKRKRMYYLDTTPEIISALSRIAKHEIVKDKKGYYVDGWYQTTLTEPFKMETNNYRLEEN